MLPSTSSGEALLAFPPYPPWNLPSFTMSTLSSPCSRFDSSFLAKVWFHSPWLSPPSWSGTLDRQPTALSVALRPLFLFRQAQYAQVFRLTLVLFSPLCLLLHLSSYLKLSGRNWFSLLLCYQATMGSRVLASSEKQRCWWTGKTGCATCALCNPLSFSLFWSLASTLVFSRTGGALFHLNSSTHRVSLDCLREICVSLVKLAAYSLVYAATLLFFWDWQNREAFYAAPANSRPRKYLISCCTVQLRILCAARSLAFLCLPAISGPGSGKLLGFLGIHGFFAILPIPQKGSGNNSNNNNRELFFCCLFFCQFFIAKMPE